MPDKRKCIICLYVLVLSIATVISTFVLPEFDRGIVRNYSGALTTIGSIVGGWMCIFSVWLMSRGHTKLNGYLQEVYFLMFAIFLCTATFGIFGILKPPLETWDVVYNIRAVAIMLEAVALYRFFKAWWRIGRQ